MKGIGGDYLEREVGAEIHGRILPICKIWGGDLRGGESGGVRVEE